MFVTVLSKGIFTIFQCSRSINEEIAIIPHPMPEQAFVFMLYLLSEHGMKTRKDGELAPSFLHSPPLPLNTHLTVFYVICVCVYGCALLVL